MKVGDSVRGHIKPKSFKQGCESAWSKDVYKVVHISDDKKQFLVNGYTKRRVYSRHELLNIEGTEGKNCLILIKPNLNGMNTSTISLVSIHAISV